METTSSSQRPGGKAGGRSSVWPWLLGGGCVLVILLGMLLPRSARKPTNAETTGPASNAARNATLRHTHRRTTFRSSAPVPNPQAVVAGKVSRFAQSRLALVRAMAKHYGVNVPPEVEQFFTAAEAGQWERVKDLFAALRKNRESGESSEALSKLWPAILETYGVAEVAHDWPPQKLLDYGNAVLDSLRPGMIYVGGTDAGRFIPTLLNETSDGERHIVLTQNALADSTYTDYLRFQYGDQMAMFSPEDSQQAFQDYLNDARKRLAHDQEFPDEPKQVRPGEDVRITDNRVQVSGQVAVMSINERLLQMIINKNPDAAFALQESFPFKSTYGTAMPMGPIMELGTQDTQKNFTADVAAQSADYWRSTAQELLSDPSAQTSSEALQAYAKLATAQARLLADHNFTAEAEEAYRSATQIYPASQEAVFSYIDLLANQKRLTEAVAVAETAVQAAPDNQQFTALLQQLRQAASKR